MRSNRDSSNSEILHSAHFDHLGNRNHPIVRLPNYMAVAVDGVLWHVFGVLHAVRAALCPIRALRHIPRFVLLLHHRDRRRPPHSPPCFWLEGLQAFITVLPQMLVSGSLQRSMAGRGAHSYQGLYTTLNATAVLTSMALARYWMGRPPPAPGSVMYRSGGTRGTRDVVHVDTEPATAAAAAHQKEGGLNSEHRSRWGWVYQHRGYGSLDTAPSSC